MVFSFFGRSELLVDAEFEARSAIAIDDDGGSVVCASR
jgi:hypothetical protein